MRAFAAFVASRGFKIEPDRDFGPEGYFMQCLRCVVLSRRGVLPPGSGALSASVSGGGQLTDDVIPLKVDKKNPENEIQSLVKADTGIHSQ